MLRNRPRNPIVDHHHSSLSSDVLHLKHVLPIRESSDMPCNLPVGEGGVKSWIGQVLGEVDLRVGDRVEDGEEGAEGRVERSEESEEVACDG